MDSTRTQRRFRCGDLTALLGDVNRLLTSSVAAVALLSTVLAATSPANAGPLGTQIPANCVAHTSFSGSGDAEGDYRCAGLAINYHTAGVAKSPFRIWAGQWLFTDTDGQYRVGSCTFNKGVHPTVEEPSRIVTQRFPNDPSGAKGAYLTWRYGETLDNLTAAAMWVVFHYYAQDAAGTNRATNGSTPLVPALAGVAAASGRRDLQDRAVALDAEAASAVSAWTLTGQASAGGDGATFALLSGDRPLAGRTITLRVDAGTPVGVTTDAAGQVRIDAPAGSSIGASASAPGAVLVFRGAPAAPDPDGAQTLVTDGPSRVLQAEVTLAATTTTMPVTTTTVPATTTTVPVTTTTVPVTTTTVPVTTTTVMPVTTTTVPMTTVPATTSTTTAPPVTTTVAQVPPTTVAAAEPPPPSSPLPRTGGGLPIAQMATLLLVAGAGLVGTLRRRASDPWLPM